MDPSNGSTFTNLGTTQLVSVPYALHSNIADTAKYSLFAATVPPTTVSGNGNQIIVNGVSAALPTPSAPTLQKFTSGSGIYTTPNGVKWIKVSMVGGGGGGAAGYNLAAAGDEGTTSFGTSLLTCTGGAHGTLTGDNEAAGGTAIINSPAYGTAIDGAVGSSSAAFGTDAVVPGAAGASTPFGGGGRGTGTGSGYVAGSAKNNTGAGGGGGQGGTDPSGGSGVAGGYLVAFIANPSATYSYVVGGGGITGVGGISGGAVGSEIIIVEEYYQ